jgi:hypothetical protein
MEHEPCGFLSNAKRAMKLPRAYAVLVVNDHPNRRQPLSQRERRIFEYGSSFQGELRAIVLAVAFPNARLFEIDDVIGITSQAPHNTVRPAKLNHEFVTVIVVFEVDNRFSKCASKFHDSETTKSPFGLLSISLSDQAAAKLQESETRSNPNRRQNDPQMTRRR